MKKQNEPQSAKYFKYKFTKSMFFLAIAALLLCVVGIAISIYRIAKYRLRELTDYLTSPLLIGICLLCIVVVIALLIRSRYIVTEEHYITQFGLIKSKFPIKDITAVVLDTATNKLTIKVGEQYSVLSLSPEWNHDFVQALRDVNPKIDYSFTTEESPKKEEN